MKSASPQLLDFLSTNKLGWRADLYTITLISGTVLRWTTCDVDLNVNGNTWLGRGAVLGRGNTRQTSRLEIDSIDVQLNGAYPLAISAYSQTTIASLIIAGAFDYARVQVDHMVGAYPGDQSVGLVLGWFEGRWAGSDSKGLDVNLKVESELAALNVPVPRFATQAACSNAVYDANCGLVNSAYLVGGSVTLNPGVDDPVDISFGSKTAAIAAKPNGYFNLGVMAITTGPNVGQRRAIKSFTSDGTTGLFTMTFAFSPQLKNTFSFNAYPGCPRTMAACNAFPNGLGSTSNLVNFRGFPYVPRPETNH